MRTTEHGKLGGKEGYRGKDFQSTHGNSNFRHSVLRRIRILSSNGIDLSLVVAVNPLQ